MKTNKFLQLSLTMVITCLLISLTGCGRKFEMKDVYMSLPNDIDYFLSEYGIYGGYEYDAYGDIVYKAKEELSQKNECIEVGDDFEDVPFFYISDLGDNQEYTITSNLHEGYKLSVKAKKYEDAYIYEKITLVHPLSMPYDSIVCTDLMFEGHNYGIGLDSYDSRPCAGTIKVYRVNEDEKYLSNEMVEASSERTIWKEYYPNGNVKSIKTTTSNPQETDKYGYSAKPFITNTENFFEDGTKKTFENVIYRKHGGYALFETDFGRNGKPIWAVFLKEEQMVVFVNSSNIHKQLEAELRYNYEIQDNKLRFYNGWERYGIARVKHYPETKAEIFLENDGVYFKNMKQYGNLNIHMSATLTRDYLPAQLLEFVKKYANTTLRGE